MHIHLAPAGVDLVQRAEKIAATRENPALRALTAAERALLIELLMKVAGGRAGKRGWGREGVPQVGGRNQ